MTQCRHLEVEDSVCVACRTCVHELVLNGSCYYCGEDSPEVAFKPSADPVVPASSLIRPKK